jgi:GNAT superfamily N-acetyltransferase
VIELVPDEPAFAPAIAALWNAATLGRSPIMPELWSACTTGDPSYRPGDAVVARDGERLVGVCLAKRFRGSHPGNGVYQGIGFVGLLAVDPEYQRQGLGSKLLAAAEARLRDEGVDRLRLGGGYGHLFPGVPEALWEALPFFERHGYVPDDAVWDVRASLEAVTLPEVVLPEGMSVRPYRSEEALVRFLDRVFPGRWPTDAVDWVAAGRPVGWTIGLFEGERACGFCQIHPAGSFGTLRWKGFNPGISALGPIGIDPAVRGKGLGLALLVAGLKALRAQGATDTVIDWTTLLEFYGRCGFEPWLQYRMARKVLS